MKRILLTFAPLFLIATLVLGQGTEGVVDIEGHSFTYHYFEGHAQEKVSSMLLLPVNGNLGFATAYDLEGNEIYRQSLGGVDEPLTVTFQYHPNGAVRTAIPEPSTAIFGSVFHFDQFGKLPEQIDKASDVTKLSSEGPNEVVSPGVKPDKPCPKVDIVEQYHTECFVVNTTPKPITIRFGDREAATLADSAPHLLQPGDTLLCGSWVSTDPKENPCRHLKFELEAKNKRWLRDVAMDAGQPLANPNNRFEIRCYDLIMRRKIPFY